MDLDGGAGVGVEEEKVQKMFQSFALSDLSKAFYSILVVYQ